MTQAKCPTCGATREVGSNMAWRIQTGRNSGDCKSCSLRKKRYPGRKNPGGIKLQDPLARSLYKTRFYRCWADMKTRCTNPRYKQWDGYGGRGIKVCDRWMSFEGFVWDMYGSYRPGLTLDRINNDGDYEPDNCRWVSRAVQVRNTRRNQYLTHEGRTLTVSEWAREVGINRQTIEARLRRGWTTERALAP